MASLTVRDAQNMLFTLVTTLCLYFSLYKCSATAVVAITARAVTEYHKPCFSVSG